MGINARNFLAILLLPAFSLSAQAFDFSGSAQLVLYSSSDTLSIARECRPRWGLPNFFRKLKNGRAVTVAYVGGSITEAASGYREQSAAWIQQQYSAAKVSAINAGVGGTGADLACFRLKKQVLGFDPDLVFIEFAVNDKDTDTATIHETMEGMVRQIWRKNASTDICFVYTMTADMASVVCEGKLPPAARAMEDIAEYYHIPSVNMCLGIAALFNEGKLVFKGSPEDFPGKIVFSADNVHPYPQTGHRLYTEALTRSLQKMGSLHKNNGMRHLGHSLTLNGFESAQMISPERLEKTGKWKKVLPSMENAGVLSPNPFPLLLKADSAGSSILVKFEGSIVGLYDAMGPGSGIWEILLDGVPYRTYTRFDSFCTYWRPNYVLLKNIKPGLHTVEFRVSSVIPDKKLLLGDKVNKMISDPLNYSESNGYAGYLLLAGNIIEN
jgi:hypothetical protein